MVNEAHERKVNFLQTLRSHERGLDVGPPYLVVIDGAKRCGRRWNESSGRKRKCNAARSTANLAMLLRLEGAMSFTKAKSKNEPNPPELAGPPELVAQLLVHLAELKEHSLQVGIL